MLAAGGAQAQVFAPKTDYLGGNGPSGVAIGDVNADGNPDVVTTYMYANQVAVRLGTGNGALGSSTTYAVGGYPCSPRLVDLNKDGRLDIVTAELNSGTVSVLLKLSGTGFSPAASYRVGDTVYGTAFGDVNGDGNLDIVATGETSFTGQAMVLLGQGAGAFGLPTKYPVGDRPMSIILFDTNADGQLDIATANSLTSSVSVLLGQAGGTFRAQTSYPTGGSPNSVVAADIDGDGRADLVVNNGLAVSVLLALPGGGFGPNTSYPTVNGSRDLAVRDLTGDSRPDLLVLGSDNTVTLLPGLASGGFGLKSTYPTGKRPFGLALGNLNGDQYPDLVVANQDDNSISVLLGLAGNNAAALTGFSPTAGPVGSTITITGTRLVNTNIITFAGTGNNTVSTGFFINAAGTEISNIQVPGGAVTGPISVTTPYGTTSTSGLPTPSFTVQPTLTLTATGPVRNSVDAPVTTPLTLTFDQPPTAASAATIAVFSSRYRGRRALGPAVVSGNQVTLPMIDGDFRPGETIQVSVPTTVQSSTGAGARAVAYQFTTATAAGAGTFTQKTDYPAMSRPDGSLLGDLNNDGHLDLVVFGNNLASVMNGSPAGTFGPKTDYAVPGMKDGTLGDVNGDGRLDLVAACGYNQNVTVLLGLASGGLDQPVAYATTSDQNRVTLGDVNNDGRLDIISLNSSVSVLLNLGSGGFGRPVDYATSAGAAGVAVGDLNRDGRLDIVTTNTSIYNANVSVLLGLGLGRFGPKTDYNTGPIPHGIAFGDMNGDGILDIVTANEATSITGSASVTLLLGVGDGTFGTRTDYPTFGGSANVALGDVNGDGILDIVTANYLAYNVGVLIRNASGRTASVGRYTTGDYPVSVALGDVNGDGRLDIVTANNNANSVSVLLGLSRVPSLVSLAPASAPRGSAITLNGYSLTGATAITFAGTAANTVGTGFAVSADGRQITNVVVPNGAITGDMTVTTPMGKSNTLLFTLSVVNATAPTATTATAWLWPNPAQGVFTVAVPAGNGSAGLPISLRLTNALGQTVYRTLLPPAPNHSAQTADIDVHHLAPGLYSVQLKAGNALYNSRLILE